VAAAWHILCLLLDPRRLFILGGPEASGLPPCAAGIRGQARIVVAVVSVRLKLWRCVMNELTIAAEALRTVIRKTWWVPLVQGVAALIVGLSLLTRPAPTLVVLTIFLGAYWFVGGIFDAVGAVSRRHSDRHWLLALVGALLSIFVGLLLLGRPIL